MRRPIAKCALLAAFWSAHPTVGQDALRQVEELQARRPNVVVLLVDDAGLMDFGSFGGEANTPHIDRLAATGRRFGNYHTSPLCAPSRAMLLTGLDSHRTGVGTIPEIITREQEAEPAYAQRLLPGVQTLADRYRAMGYQTFMTGKWHLGRGDGDLPNHHGFDRSFVLDASGADNWAQKSYMPFYAEAPWYEDGEPATLPEDFYSSTFLVDQMIEYLEGRDEDEPFFSYVAFQAVHIPVQAPAEFVERYEGVYADGWSATRERRFERARQLGLLPADVQVPPMHPDLRAWQSLSEEERLHYERSMMVNAAMLEAMDHEIGRLLAWLERSGEFDDTIFVITSDNGPEFGEPISDPTYRLWMRWNGYHVDPERAGGPGYLGAIGAEWASAAAAPGALFKMYATEGGTRVPLILSGPGIDGSEQSFDDGLAFVTDLAPTLLELTGAPANLAAEMDGRSLLPTLRGEVASAWAEDSLVLEVGGNSAIYRSGYKMTRNTLPHGDAKWRLFDLTADPTEAVDLSAQQPALRAELLTEYAQWAEALGVVELAPTFDLHGQLQSNTRALLLQRYRHGLIVLLLLFAVSALLGWMMLRRSRSRPVSTT